MRYSCVALLILMSFGCQPKHDTPEIILLHDNWEFRDTNDTIWNVATVPGNVHSDLLDNELIDDPFIGDNELKLQWVSETDWEYKTHFKIDKETFKKKHIALNFEGLDTYASVFLNDSLILKANNAFREFQIDVKSILKSENDLRIIFETTSKYEEKEKAKLMYTLPEGNRIFTRKAQFQYGWDWGPKLNTSGIWRSIKLSAWNDFKIDDIYVEQFELDTDYAHLGIQMDISENTFEELNYDVTINGKLYKSFENVILGQDRHAAHFLPVTIEHPKRWWPHNLGEPYLYDVKVVVRDGKTVLDSVSRKIGLRTIDLVTEKDSLGESFYFMVNDVPVYAKGANYIPQNSMQNKVTEKHYEQLLDDVVDANMNMLRVWGGGIYENDIFYDLCDEKGILVWQDFMFACAMYPGDNTYLENVTIEAKQQIQRLRNHASIALWCGNNENSEGWHRWGWQAGKSDAEKDEIWNNYLKVFDSILPNAVEELSDIAYWESSPKYGRGNPKYKTEGDAHDWWIWHDAYPFEHLEENIPRFMSEFGFQSFPSYDAIKFINQSDTINITSKAFQSHQKHSRGFQLIDEYMQKDFPVPDNAEDYVYMSQLVQAYGITKGIEAQRRAKPYNMGTLYWQLNDCWPVVSWSSIDFFGNWKALHYKAKRSFENVLISSKAEHDILKIYVVNDNMEEYNRTLNFRILDFDGKELFKSDKPTFVTSNSSTLIYELDLKTLQLNRNDVVVVSKFEDVESYFYLVKPKELKLKQGPIQKKITKTSDGFQIELSATTLQKDVFLFCNEAGHFSDNYFDLMPNETKTIEFKTASQSLDNLRIKTFNNLIR